MSRLIRLEMHDGWAEVWLDRADKRNALAHALVDELLEAFTAIGRSGRSVAVLGGTGPVFCAGGDREETQVTPVASDRLLEELRSTPLFVMARVDGPAYGAGVSLAASCPVVVASSDAFFALPEASMGNLPVPIAYLESVISARKLLEIGVRGAQLSAPEALEAGLVTELGDGPGAVTGAVSSWVESLLARPEVADQARRWWQERLAVEVVPRDAALRALLGLGVTS